MKLQKKCIHMPKINSLSVSPSLSAFLVHFSLGIFYDCWEELGAGVLRDVRSDIRSVED